MARASKVRQYRYVADRVIRGVRLQHARLTERAEREPLARDVEVAADTAADMEFFILAFQRLGELVRKTKVHLQLGDEADELWHDFQAPKPELDELRNWIAHPAEIKPPTQLVTSDARTAWYRNDRGAWQQAIEIDGDLQWCETVYQRLCSILDDALEPGV